MIDRKGKETNMGNNDWDHYQDSMEKPAFCPYCGAIVMAGDEECVYCRRKLPVAITSYRPSRSQYFSELLAFGQS